MKTETRLFLAVAVAITSWGCADSASELTELADDRLQSFPVERITSPREMLSDRLSDAAGACIVARRAPDGRYFSRLSTVALPAEVTLNASRTARFAYRGWASNSSEPVLLAVCSLPDVRNAQLFFEKTFGGSPRNEIELRQLASNIGIRGWQDWGSGTSPHLMQGAGLVHVIDGEAGKSPAVNLAQAVRARLGMALSSDFSNDCAIAIIPPPECEGWMPEDETTPNVPPPPFPEPDIDIVAYEEPFILGPICTVSTDYPHLSTTSGFGGNINVKSKNQCTAPMYQMVQSTLQRQSCFLWIFCGWPAIAQSVPYTNPSAMQVVAPASSTCAWSDGWYRGTGYHKTIYLGATRIRYTGTQAVRIRCL